MLRLADGARLAQGEGAARVNRPSDDLHRPKAPDACQGHSGEINRHRQWAA